MPQISKHFNRSADYIGQLNYGHQASDIYLTYGNEANPYNQNGDCLCNLQKGSNPLNDQLMLQQCQFAPHGFLIGGIHYNRLLRLGKAIKSCVCPVLCLS